MRAADRAYLGNVHSICIGICLPLLLYARARTRKPHNKYPNEKASRSELALSDETHKESKWDVGRSQRPQYQRDPDLGKNMVNPGTHVQKRCRPRPNAEGKVRKPLSGGRMRLSWEANAYGSYQTIARFVSVKVPLLRQKFRLEASYRRTPAWTPEAEQVVVTAQPSA